MAYINVHFASSHENLDGNISFIESVFYVGKSINEVNLQRAITSLF